MNITVIALKLYRFPCVFCQCIHHIQGMVYCQFITKIKLHTVALKCFRMNLSVAHLSVFVEFIM